MTSGLAVPVVLSTLLASTVLPAYAQAGPGAANDPTASSTRQGLPGHRRFLLATVGAAVGLVPALLATEREDSRGSCMSRSCISAVGASMGAVAGYLLGRDLDRSAAARAARGPALRLPSQRVELDLVPEAVDAYEGGAIVIGRDGIVMVGPDQSVRRRGGTIRGVTSVAAVPAYDAMLAATSSGIYSFALTGSETQGRMVLRGDGVALQSVAADQVVLSSSNLVRRLRLSGRGPMLELAEEARVEGGGLATALAFAPQAGVLWTLNGDRLVARTTQLQEIGNITLPAIGRTISISGGRALVAAGTAGLFLLDVQQPSAPRLLGQVRGIGFVFDAVLDGDTAYVAGGRSGLLVLDVTDPAAARVVGVASNFGFVSSVALAPDGQVYVTDREGERLYLVQPRTSGSAARER